MSWQADNDITVAWRTMGALALPPRPTALPIEKALTFALIITAPGRVYQWQ